MDLNPYQSPEEAILDLKEMIAVSRNNLEGLKSVEQRKQIEEIVRQQEDLLRRIREEYGEQLRAEGKEELLRDDV